MRTTQRRPAASVIEHLAAEPQQYQLTQAILLLVRWLARQGIGYEQAMTDVIRFKNSLRLGFPASEIESLHPSGNYRLPDVAEVFAQGKSTFITITPAVIGLLGVTGTLPLHHTERIVAHQWRTKDDGPRTFIDMLSHRLVALYCQAWGKHRLEYVRNMGRPDAQRPLLLAAAGIDPQRLSDDIVSADLAAYHAGLLRMRPVSTSVISNVLRDYFQVPVKVEALVGSWDPVPPAMRSTLGTRNPTLGYGATLGTRVWRHDKRLRLVIGPLAAGGFKQFLPRGKASVALARVLTLFATQGLEYEVQLLLAPDCVAPLVIGGGKCLGWETFLLGATAQPPAKAIRYVLPVE